jgi:probable rRNA maturation factor
VRIAIIDLQQTPIDRPLLRRAVRRAAKAVSHSYAAVTVALVDDPRIAELNRIHRHRDRPTDVLAYGGDPEEPAYMGDVVVSVDTAARQAREAGRPLDHEVAWLAAHGVLHLLGMDDATRSGRGKMIASQDQALQQALGRR